MTSPTSQEFESFVPVYDTVPEKWEDARPFLVETLKKITNGVNIREIGWFLDEELLSGKAFIPGPTLPGNNPGQFRQILRKVIDFGQLPNTGTKSVPHGILVDSNFTLMQMYAAATDPILLQAIPLPFSAATAIENIQMYMDSVNVNIITARNFSNYTRCFVVIEYIQEI